jgi:hypothetical protein
MIVGRAGGHIAGSSAVVTVSGQAVSNTDGPGPVAAQIRFTSTGIVQRGLGGSYAQVDSATDWIIPNSASAGPGAYHIRATLNAQTGSGTRTGTLGSWLALTSTRTWELSKPTAGIATWDLDIEISDDGGSTTLDTGLYELTVEVL